MAIEHRRLGRHGVLVSNLCLGTMNFGNQATEISLDAATLARLEEIFPGPGGEAPKAYAW